jgi:hypothetical protein
VLGPSLNVTHLLAFSLTAKAPTLRIVRLPAGPSLSFRIERYSLMKDIINSKKRKRSKGLEYLTPPLVRTLPDHPRSQSDSVIAGLGSIPNGTNVKCCTSQFIGQDLSITIPFFVAAYNISILGPACRACALQC